MRTRTKWILISILVVVCVIFGVYRYFIYVMQDTRQEEAAAILRAKQEAGLTETTEVTKSVWDDVCWVVEGTDGTGQHVMVWLENDKKPHTELADQGKTKADMKASIHTLMPTAKIVRLLPGIYQDEYVWQLFYKEKDHYYYRFFKFSDGSPLTEEFTLPNR